MKSNKMNLIIFIIILIIDLFIFYFVFLNILKEFSK